jgi:hypothetical protein
MGSRIRRVGWEANALELGLTQRKERIRLELNLLRDRAQKEVIPN